MDSTNKYILKYLEDFVFDFTEHISTHIFDVEIEIDVFEHNTQFNHREKAHVIFRNGNLKYECDFCDTHKYESDFYPIILDDKHFICFRKTLYGFMLINADTLTVEFEYFPECVLEGEESFIVVDAKQLDEILIFEGCYWACPDECFAFDYKRKLFLNVSKMCGIISLSKTVLQNNELVIHGNDENDSEKQFTFSKKDLLLAIDKYGKTDF